MIDVAVVIGGSADVLREFDQAAQLCFRAGVSFETFVVNDMIAEFPQCDHAVTLHPYKLQKKDDWLGKRKVNGLPMPREVWCHRTDADAPAVTRTFKQVDPGKTSSGYFAAHIALHCGHDRVILCGVPMTMEGGHFKRRAPWDAMRHFRKVWVDHRAEFMPKTRSMSGWTMDLFGYPDVGFLRKDACQMVA